MSFPKYPDYKPSRLDTKAPLPSSWPEAPIKRAFDIVSGSTPKTDNEEFWDGEMTWVTPADLSGLDAVDVTESKRTITEAGLLSCGTTLVPAGSIVISTRAPIGTLAIAGKELCTNQGCKTLVPNGECSSRFAYYYLSACTEQLNIKGRGTTFLELSGDELGSFLMPKPAPVEQDLICAFLDSETAKIDALIAEQQRLIELLQEKRQAVISHAVTKGLNPNAPMKDSGVEWLGEVPEHWEVPAIGYVLDAVGDVDHYMPPSTAQGVPYVMTGDLKELASQIDFEECKQIAIPDYERLCRKIITSKGDLIMARYATIGTVAYVDVHRDFVVSYSCVTIKPNASRVSGRFLFFCLKSNSFTQGVRQRVNANTQENVGIGDLKRVRIAMPPLDEQIKITNHLQALTSDMEEVIEVSKDTVRLLQERRSALISAAVTGQIDVRGLATEEEP